MSVFKEQEGSTRVKGFFDALRAKNSHSKKSITILGAGIAGLVAVYELKKLGHDVEIIEASKRVVGCI